MSHHDDVLKAKAATARAMLTLLGAMKRAGFQGRDNATEIEVAFESLLAALTALNGAPK